ncbi:MAG: MFS transporter [Burkholderiaceae bacterium]|jgi:predicted MFS family arabinose efflux permease|nr:MFS transporter [Burkholderiaceae bacterium]
MPAMNDASAKRLIAIVCSAQALVQIGAFFWPALLPSMMLRWELTNSDAGWITGIFYAAYMVSVPLLVTLTDRVDPRAVYLFGVGCTIVAHSLFGLVADGFWSALALRAIAGVGWAGTYMTGLKLLVDIVDKKIMSRAVTGHAASIGISGAISFACADLLAKHFGWAGAFILAGTCALTAWLLVVTSVPKAPEKVRSVELDWFDFRPVISNRSSMAYAIAYCAHTLEMNALRGWGVAFLTFVAARADASDGAPLLTPTTVLTLLGIVGTAASVLGNEASIRIGRRNLIMAAMLCSAICATSLGFMGSNSYVLAVVLMLLYAFIVWLDSSSLTAGAAGTADPQRRGATLAVHSTLGYAGGFVGPLIIGWTLDLSGGKSPTSWGLSFLLIAICSLVAMVIFLALRPRELAGEGSKASGSG